MAQLVARLNKPITSGSWIDPCGNTWTASGTLLKAAQDPAGGK